MTAQCLRDCGRSFLIVMDLLEDCPCDLKCNPDCTADDDEQLKNVFQLHEASPFRVCVRGKGFTAPGHLPEEVRPPFYADNTRRRFRRHFYFSTLPAVLQSDPGL